MKTFELGEVHGWSTIEEAITRLQELAAKAKIMGLTRTSVTVEDNYGDLRIQVEGSREDTEEEKKANLEYRRQNLASQMEQLKREMEKTK